MTFNNYRTTLLNTTQNYESQKGKRLSNRRKKDVEELQQIIQDPTITNPLTLKLTVAARVTKIRTGWWIFQTGNSELKKAMMEIITSPQYQPEKIIREEIELAQQQLIVLQSKVDQLSKKLEEQQDKILENTIQIKLQYLRLGKEQFYFSYEEYLLNILDKFIMKQPLHTVEAEHLLNLLNDEDFNKFDIHIKGILTAKIADACESAFRTLSRGIDHLIDQDTLQLPTFKCLTAYANYFCQSVQRQDGEMPPQFERLTNKLLSSYYQDGSGKTKVSSLSTYSKMLVLDSKETLICHYGTERQRASIAPLCELRRESRWEEFKTMCVQKSQYLFQWLKSKKSAAPVSKSGSKNSVLSEVSTEKAGNENKQLTL